MPHGEDEIETRIESLAQELVDLRDRVRRLEERRPTAAAVSRSATPPAQGFPSLNNATPAEVIGLAGRTLVILGGAFLLRAVSAAAVLPDVSGPVIGLIYAAWWMSMADRSVGTEARSSAFFYGLTALVTADPLLWEATSRFGLLPGVVAAPTIVAFLGGALAVAARRDLAALAWTAVLVSLATTLALFASTREFVLYTGTLVAVVVVTEAFVFRGRWLDLRWAPAVAIDLTLLLVAMLVSRPRMSTELVAQLHPVGIVAVSLVAPAVYLVSVATTTLVRRQTISAFEIAQVTVSLLCGIGTALVTMSYHGGDPRIIAATITALGATCYAVAFRSMDVAEHPPRNFYAYTTFAGVLVGVGTTLLLDGEALALTWLALALVGVAFGLVRGRNTLRLHGALYLGAAFAASGLAAAGLHGLVGPVESLRPRLTTPMMVIAIGSLAAYAALTRRHLEEGAHWSSHVPRLLVAAMSFWIVAGLGAPWLTAGLLAAGENLSREAWLATMRTCVLSSMIAALAWAGRRFDLDDHVWLVFPLLLATGARLLWEDLAYGAPVNLFLALAFYGGALIATSRLLRKEP